MSFFHILHFSFRLISKKKGRSFLTFFSIALGVMMMFLFLSFSTGVKEFLLGPILEKSSPNILLVRKKEPQSGVLQAIDLLTKGSKISQEDTKKIQDIPHVKNVGRKMLLEFPSSLRISLFGIGFNTDVPIFGVDPLLSDLPINKFTIEENEKIPVIISPRLMDLFNSSFADAIPGVGKVSEDELIGREFTLIFGKSSFFSGGFGTKDPQEFSAYLAGFSEKIPEVGIAIPLEKGLKMNEYFTGKKSENTSFYELFVEVDTEENVSKVQKNLQKQRFNAKSFEELGEEIRLIIWIITFVFIATGSIILLLSFFSLLSLITVSILEQQKNIGILRALGAKKRTIFFIFLTETGVISFFGCLFGMLMGAFFAYFFNRILLSTLPPVSFLPQNLFPFSPEMILCLFFIVILLSLLFSLFPAFSAARKDPIKAIWG